MILFLPPPPRERTPRLRPAGWTGDIRERLRCLPLSELRRFTRAPKTEPEKVGMDVGLLATRNSAVVSLLLGNFARSLEHVAKYHFPG